MKKKNGLRAIASQRKRHKVSVKRFRMEEKMGNAGNQVRMNLDRMKEAMETCEATAIAAEEVIGDLKTTMTGLEDNYMGEDADTLQVQMGNYLDGRMSEICLNVGKMKQALEEGLEKARFCKNYCQHFVDALGGGANQAVSDNREIPGSLFCDYDAVAGLMAMCTKAGNLTEEIRQSTYDIERILDLEIVSFNVESYTCAVRTECNKIDRLDAHRRNLENYASFVETTDMELAGALARIYDTFTIQEPVERRKLDYGKIDAKVKKMQPWGRIREDLIAQYGEEIVKEWGEVTLVEMMEKMHGLPVGYADEETINMLGLCQTEEDRIFVGLMMQGKYDEAFAVPPNELSPEISLILADYSAHLLRYGKNEKYEEGAEVFTEFNNAMLASGDYIRVEVNGVKEYVEKKYWQAYLEMMIEGGAVQLKAEEIKLSLMDPYAEDYDMSYYSSCFMTHAIFCTENAMMYDLRHRNEDIQCKFSDLEMIGNSMILFSINHDSPTYGEAIEKVSIGVMGSGEDVQLNNDMVEMSEARKEQERLIQEYVYSLCSEGALAVLSACAPEVAVAASLMMMALEGKAGSISGTKAFLDGNLQTTAFGIANKWTSDTINTIADFEAAAQNMDAVNHKVLMEMMGSGAKYDMVSATAVDNVNNSNAFTGIYNPDVLRAINYWNNNGAAGWSGWSEKEIENIYTALKDRTHIQEKIENDYMNGNIKYTYEEFREQCERILKGGGIFIDNEMNTELFFGAIEEINELTGVNLREEFMEWVKNEQGYMPENSNLEQEAGQ